MNGHQWQKTLWRNKAFCDKLWKCFKECTIVQFVRRAFVACGWKLPWALGGINQPRQKTFLLCLLSSGWQPRGTRDLLTPESFCALTCEHRHRNITSISLGRNVAKIAFPPFPAPPKCDAQADPPDLQDGRSSILRHLSLARQSLEWRRSVWDEQGRSRVSNS